MFKSLIISIALNSTLLLLGWFMVLVLEYVWSGMAKFLRVILFPGRLLHVASHYMMARMLNIRIYEVMRIGFEGEAITAGLFLSSEVYNRRPYAVYAVALSPMLTAVPFFLVLRWILLVLVDIDVDAALFVAWLVISIFLLGMPCLSDIRFLFLYHVIKHAEIIIALFWGVVVFVLGFIAYGLEAASIGLLIYLMLVLLISLVPPGRGVCIIED